MENEMIHFCSDTVFKDVTVELQTDYIEPSSRAKRWGCRQQ